MFNDQFQQPGRPSPDSHYSSYHRESRNVHVVRFHQALNLFNRAVAQGKLRNILLFLLHKPRRLTPISVLNLIVLNAAELGLRVVLIDHIRGTEGRIKDFDNRFLPLSERLRDRWVNIATASLEGYGLPAVNLIQIGNQYYVRDGHHRISVARALGQEAIDAKIILWRT